MLRNLLLAATAAALLTACPTLEERDEAFSAVAFWEARVEALTQAEPSLERNQALTRAREELAVAREYATGVDGLTGANADARKVDAATDLATGDIAGLILGGIGTLGLFGKVLLGRGRKTAQELIEEESAKRDESRELQGLAGAKKRSVQQIASPVAQAAKTVTAPGSLTAPSPVPADRSWEPKRAQEID